MFESFHMIFLSNPDPISILKCRKMTLKVLEMMSIRKVQEEEDFEVCSFRNTFTPEEDEKLKRLVKDSGDRPIWKSISAKMNGKSPRQCRERYKNYLSPSLLHHEWSPEEDRLILEKHQELGNRWMAISRCLKGRSGNSVRNRWQILTRKHVKNSSPLLPPSEINSELPQESEKLGVDYNIPEAQMHEFSSNEIFERILEKANKFSIFNGGIDDNDVFEIY